MDSNGLGNGQRLLLKRVPSSQIENGGPHNRPRAGTQGTQVTSACYSDNDDEKQGLIFEPHSNGNKITDLGVVETKEYLQDLEVHRMPPVPMKREVHRVHDDYEVHEVREPQSPHT